MRPTRLFAFVACLVATGCVSSAPEDDGKVSQSDAARYNTQLGVTYLRRGDLEAAKEKLEKAALQDPKFPQAQAALGILYERTGDMDKARDHLREATRLAPDNANIINGYGGFLCRQGNRKEGIQYFQRAASNAYYRTPETALTNAGVCARGVPDPAAAESFFRKALAKDPAYGEALLQMADLKLEQGEALKARAFLQRYESVGPETPLSLSLGRQIEMALGNQETAADYARRLREQFPQSAEAGSLGDG